MIFFHPTFKKHFECKYHIMDIDEIIASFDTLNDAMTFCQENNYGIYQIMENIREYKN